MSIHASESNGSLATQALRTPRLDVVIFDGKDFGLWKMRMEGLFMAHDILPVVETNIAELAITGATEGTPVRAIGASGGDPAASALSQRTATSASGGAPQTRRQQGGAGHTLDTSLVEVAVADKRDELIRKSHLAYGLLIQSLKDEQLRLVQGVARGNAHGIWKILLATYERKSMATRVQLLEHLFGTQLLAKETIASYVARLTELERRLRAQGEQVSESIMVYLLLRGLTPPYTSIVQLLKMKDNIEFTETVETLKNEEERQQGTKAIEHANAVERQLQKGCFSSGSHSHVKFNCPLNSNKKRCENCRRIGHTKRECRGLQDQHADAATMEQGNYHHAY